MKKKFEFTSRGVEQRIVALYAQRRSSIEEEAKSVAADCIAWLQHNFDLMPSQVEYLQKLGLVFSQRLGEQLAYAFRHRMPIALHRGDLHFNGYVFIREERKQTVFYAPEEEPVYVDSLNYYIS